MTHEQGPSLEGAPRKVLPSRNGPETRPWRPSESMLACMPSPPSAKRPTTTIRSPRVVSAAPRAARGPATTKPTEGRVFVLDVPFASRAAATAAGARWDDVRKVFVYRSESLPPSLAPLRGAHYSWERAVEDELNGEGVPATQPAPSDALTPRAHQRAAIEAIASARKQERPGFLLADDVGLGKTISAWGAVLADREAERVLIVCPLSVIAHWRRTIERMGDGGRRVVIINYDRLSKLFEVPAAARSKVKSKKGIARRGEAASFDIVIWDESHRCKNPAAARSKLAAKLCTEAGFSLWLSATAGQNPLELSYLAPLLASCTGSKSSDLRDFEHWCQEQGLGVERGSFGRWTWAGNPRDCEAVRAMLFEGRVPAGLRRRPEDIAGWPELNRILAPVALEGEARTLYEQAWTDFRTEMSLLPRGKNPKNALAAMLRLRQKSSLIRASGTAELVQELLDNGHQVAVSVAFTETLEVIAEQLEGAGHRCARIHGTQDAATRESQRIAFQRGECSVVLFTVEEGISLHQGEYNEVPRSQVIHDLRWSAIQMAQIEGRCHRDGKFAQVYWAYADASLEERIAGIVCGRITAMKSMIGDDVTTLDEIKALLQGACE